MQSKVIEVTILEVHRVLKITIFTYLEFGKEYYKVLGYTPSG